MSEPPRSYWSELTGDPPLTDDSAVIADALRRLADMDELLEYREDLLDIASRLTAMFDL